MDRKKPWQHGEQFKALVNAYRLHRPEIDQRIAERTKVQQGK